MAQLAIKGHATRGKEVIKILEMLGGKNGNHCCGAFLNRIYFINEDGYIESCDSMNHLDYEQFTIGEFLEKFPYKVGDKLLLNNGDVVKITNVYWSGILVVYEAESTLTPREYDSINAEQLQPYVEQSKEKDMSVPEAMKQITDVTNASAASTQQDGFRISNEDIVDKSKFVFRKDAPNKTELVLGDDFEIEVEYGKTYVVRKQPQYPKTYEECCKILFPNSLKLGKVLTSGYNCELLKKFGELLICRDAYWKIAGDWEPDWTDTNSKKFIICSTQGKLERSSSVINSALLSFPTAEMRDAFYENFKELINDCKELL